MTVRTRARLSEATIAVVAAALLLTVSVSRPAGQIAQTSITLLSRDQRRAIGLMNTIFHCLAQVRPVAGCQRRDGQCGTLDVVNRILP